MKSLVLLVVLSVGCSGGPLSSPDLGSLADQGLRAALAKVNAIYAASRLYRVTGGSVTRAIALSQDTTDLFMTFDIRETECTKSSGSDPQTCALRPGFLVVSPSCSSRVRLSSTSTQVLSLTCGRDTSSSSESSEEISLRNKHHFSLPIAPPPPPPAQPGRVLLPPPPRGDTFSNYLDA